MRIPNWETPAIIVDLDGTLCNNQHRQHFIDTPPKDWKAFYDGIPEDELNEWCELIISHLPLDYHVLLVSGRPKDYWNITVSWLEAHGIAYDALFMREKGDFREDHIVKEEIYNKEIKPYYKVKFCLDDRQQVVDMWRRNGLTCLQCAEGKF